MVLLLVVFMVRRAILLTAHHAAAAIGLLCVVWICVAYTVGVLWQQWRYGTLMVQCEGGGTKDGCSVWW